MATTDKNGYAGYNGKEEKYFPTRAAAQAFSASWIASQKAKGLPATYDVASNEVRNPNPLEGTTTDQNGNVISTHTSGAAAKYGIPMNPGSGNTSSPASSGNTISYNGQTYTLSSPEEASFLTNAILPFLDQMKNQGLAINPALDLGPDTIAKILKKAQSVVHPQYAQQIDAVLQDLNRNTATAAQDYGSSIAGQEQNFKETLGNSREANAGAGLAFSGGRGLEENNLLSTQNRNLASLSSRYGSQLGDYGRAAEEKLGSSALQGYNLPSLTNYSASLSGNGGFDNSGAVSTGYVPGTYKIGSIDQSETAAGLALRNTNVEEASRRKAAGLSFEDLYQ